MHKPFADWAMPVKSYRWAAVATGFGWIKRATGFRLGCRPFGYAFNRAVDHERFAREHPEVFA